MDENPYTAPQAETAHIKPIKRPKWGLGLKIAFILFGFVPAMVYFGMCVRMILAFFLGWSL